MDEWLTVRNTFLIPKSEDTQLPCKYRSINNLSANNVQTSDKNPHRNDIPAPNTRKRSRGRTEGDAREVATEQWTTYY